jgi:hypothetical protein
MSEFHKDGVIEDESATLMFDDMFAMIASKTNGIEHLLDLFFNFLKRKTDFYIDYDNTNIKKDNSTNTSDTSCSNEISIKYKMGFPKGIAEKLLIKSFRKYPYVDYFTAMKQSQHCDDNQSINNSNYNDNNNATTYYRQSIESNNDTNATTLSSSSIPPISSSSFSSISTAASSISLIQYTSDGKQIPIGNGGIGLNGSYYWTQTLNDVTIYIDNTIISTSNSSGSSSCDQKHSQQQKIKGKDVKCIIKPLSLLLEIYGHTLIQGQHSLIIFYCLLCSIVINSWLSDI